MEGITLPNLALRGEERAQIAQLIAGCSAPGAEDEEVANVSPPDFVKSSRLPLAGSSPRSPIFSKMDTVTLPNSESCGTHEVQIAPRLTNPPLATESCSVECELESRKSEMREKSVLDASTLPRLVSPPIRESDEQQAIVVGAKTTTRQSPHVESSVGDEELKDSPVPPPHPKCNTVTS